MEVVGLFHNSHFLNSVNMWFLCLNNILFKLNNNLKLCLFISSVYKVTDDRFIEMKSPSRILMKI